MIVYLDTSSLVKLYKNEAGTLEVDRAVLAADSVITSALTFVEAHSAFSLSKRLAVARQGSLVARADPSLDVEAAYAQIVAAFEGDWRARDYFTITVSRRVIARAARLSQAHPLRALDAIHLASALLLSESQSGQVLLSSFDPRQTAAASIEGLAMAH